jgi:hypothetical protein
LRDNGQWVYGNKKASKELKASEKIEQEETVNNGKKNREISSERVVNENVIGSLKRFKIVSDRYRNRRKRFGLRFNLIAGIHNFELPS